MARDRVHGWVWNWSLPLLEKELIEQASNYKTYAVRTIYAAILLLICFCVLQNSFPHRATPLTVLGIGSIIFWTLVILQEFGLYLALPILACGAITVERERKTLDLLLVTRLSPGTIVLEKFFSRLLLALNLLLLSAPVLAFSYSLGGITLDMVGLAFCGLLFTAVRLTAVGVMCSAAFKTTAQTLVATYLVIFLLYCLDRIVLECLFPSSFAAAFGRPGSSVWRLFLRETVYDHLITGSSGTVLSNLSIVWRVAIVGTCSLSISLLTIVLARWLFFIVSFQSVSRLPLIGPWLERSRERSTEKQSRRGAYSEPEFAPIRWRENPRRENLVSWWIRNILLTIIGVYLLMEIFIRTIDVQWISEAFAIGTIIVWIVVTLCLSIKASGVIVQERSRQTWDVLATTPLSGEQILQQKFASVNRMVILSQIALAMCALLRLNQIPQWSYFFASAFIIALYPPIIACQGVVCGMHTQNGAWAILKTLLVLTARCLIPFLIAFLLAMSGPVSSDAAGFFLTLVATSPLTFLVLVQTAMNETWPREAAAIPIVSVISAIVILFYLRMRASSMIDKALGRTEVTFVESLDR